MQLTLNLSDFMATCWQKQPALLRGLISMFEDPISPDELAGLAMEDCVSSRIITPQKTIHGPFEDFACMNTDGASLLVQAVNHWHPASAELFDLFRFIPNWRLDDLMVSFSTPQGTVGAHLDQYDVFIIQGQGKRRWQVGLPLSPEQARHFCHGDSFEVLIDVEMEPGDALYIPPNCPHQGSSLSDCLNYSIGFRAPSAGEALTRLADQLLDQGVPTPRLSDPTRTPTTAPGQLLTADLKQLQQLLCDYICSEESEIALASQLSEQQRELDIPDETETTCPQVLKECLLDGQTLLRTAALIPCYLVQGENIRFFIQGQHWSFSLQNLHLIKRLCDDSSFWIETTEHNLLSVEFLSMLSRLVTSGYWYLAD